MGTRVVSPKEFAAMLGVSDKTASFHMRNQRECLNVGAGKQQYLRLPLAVAEEIVSGMRPLSPVEKTEKPSASLPAKPARKKQPKPRYVAYR